MILVFCLDDKLITLTEKFVCHLTKFEISAGFSQLKQLPWGRGVMLNQKVLHLPYDKPS